MPERYEIQYDKLVNDFLWGGSKRKIPQKILLTKVDY